MTENATDRVIVMEQRVISAGTRRDRSLLKRRQYKGTARIEIGYRRNDGRWRQLRPAALTDWGPALHDRRPALRNQAGAG